MEGFHPRYVTKLYGNFMALYEADGVLMESHHDFLEARHHIILYLCWEEVLWGRVARDLFHAGPTFPEYREEARSPKGVKKTTGPGDARGKGRGKGRKTNHSIVPAQHADDEFSEPFEDLQSPAIIAPSTPPDMVGQFEIMILKSAISFSPGRHLCIFGP